MEAVCPIVHPYVFLPLANSHFEHLTPPSATYQFPTQTEGFLLICEHIPSRVFLSPFLCNKQESQGESVWILKMYCNYRTKLATAVNPAAKSGMLRVGLFKEKQ